MVFSYNLLKIKKEEVSFFLRSPYIGYQRWLLCMSVERLYSVVPVGNFLEFKVHAIRTKVLLRY